MVYCMTEGKMRQLCPRSEVLYRGLLLCVEMLGGNNGMRHVTPWGDTEFEKHHVPDCPHEGVPVWVLQPLLMICLLYTSDAADE